MQKHARSLRKCICASATRKKTSFTSCNNCREEDDVWIRERESITYARAHRWQLLRYNYLPLEKKTIPRVITHPVDFRYPPRPRVDRAASSAELPLVSFFGVQANARTSFIRCCPYLLFIYTLFSPFRILNLLTKQSFAYLNYLISNRLKLSMHVIIANYVFTLFFYTHTL